MRRSLSSMSLCSTKRSLIASDNSNQRQILALILFVLSVHQSTTEIIPATPTLVHSFQFTRCYSHMYPGTALYDYTSSGRRDGGKPYYDRRRNGSGRGGSNGGEVKSKRQERVAQIVKTELSQIIHSGLIKGANAEYLDDELRTRISVVNTDVSPDLRQARISISIRPTPRSQQILSDDDDDDDDDDSIVLEDDNEDDDEDFTENDDEDEEFMDDDGEEDEDAGMIHNDYRIRNEPNDDDTTIMSSNDITNLQNAIQQRRASPAVDRRRAFAWLVRNTKPIRYTLAQRISHMKSCPDLTFVQVDVSAAVDVMYLIDKLSATDGKYKRDNIDLFNDDDVARGIVGGLDFDAIDDDDDDDDNSDDEDWDEAVDILVKTK